MAKDYTDYVVELHGAGDRVYFQEHYRQLKKDPDISEFEVNERTYPLNKDRAYRVKGYTPWDKWDRKHPLKSIKEFVRGKKVGLIKYREPPPTTEPELVEIKREVITGHYCKICGFKNKHERIVKAHITKNHKGAKHEICVLANTETVTEFERKKEIVEPMHISKMHQPSGKVRVPNEPPDSSESLLNIITPRLLKVEIEDDTYKKAYKSYKFGNILPLAGKWWLWVIIAVVAVFVILIVTGNFQMPR